MNPYKEARHDTPKDGFGYRFGGLNLALVANPAKRETLHEIQR
ncbi:hypothetical protein OAL43_02685 [bacterium]|nr:hypothetical protein [bacterium]MDC0279091.1 hypothetical protein [bacterium]